MESLIEQRIVNELNLGYSNSAVSTISFVGFEEFFRETIHNMEFMKKLNTQGRVRHWKLFKGLPFREGLKLVTLERHIMKSFGTKVFLKGNFGLEVTFPQNSYSQVPLVNCVENPRKVKKELGGLEVKLEGGF